MRIVRTSFLFASLCVLSLSPVSVFAAPTPQPAPQPAWPLVKLGDTDTSSSARVSIIQFLLRAHHFPVKVNGQFDNQTQQAVRKFQRSKKMAVSGAVGAKTWSSLIITVYSGSEGEAVRAVQTQLAGYARLNIDGVFGTTTFVTLQSYQKRHGLEANGVASPATWMALAQDDFG